jgi:DNA-binding NarL/FixJ family response regulator
VQPAAGIVGRERELAQITAFVSGATPARALVVVGAAGIGKTTLWEAALAHARAADMRVLAARGDVAEAKLSLAGVYDLVGPVADEVLAELPPPQRSALEAALLRSEPGRRAHGPRTLATALLNALRALAKRGPLLVAVEDAQWLDRSSQEALAFAARRLENSATRMLVTVRTGSQSPLAETLAGPDTLRVELAGLSLGATRRLLSQRLDLTPPRRLLLATHAATQGNPLFTLEIGRQLAARGPAQANEPLPIPEDLPSLVGLRVAALPEGTRELLLAAALSARADAETLRTLLGRSLDDDLEPAEREGVAFLRGDRIVFAHPLHAAAVVDAATAAERRRMHGRLAAVSDELEEQARHIALSVEVRDERAAATAHAAARDALSRGAVTAAAELAELAVELGGPGSPEQARRLLDLAAFLRLAGEPARAHEVLAGTAGWAGWPPALEARARGQLLLATYWSDGATAAVELGERMLDEDLADEVRATVHTYVGGCCEFDLDRAARHVTAALQLLDRPEVDADPGTLAHALGLQVRNGVLSGGGLDSALLSRVVELEGRLPPERFATEALSPYLAVLHKHVDDLETSRRLLKGLLDEATDTGNDVGETVARMHLVLTELWGGDLAAAQAHLSRVDARFEEHGSRNVFLLAVRALVAAHTGDASTVRAVAAALEEEHGAAGAEVYGIYLGAAVGLLELSLGRAEAADATYGALLQLVEAGGHREPGIFRVHANAGEAAVAVGDLERAERIADTLATHADRTGHRWSAASADRVRALVAAARSDTGAAREHAERACAGYEALGMPLERARAVLVAGLVERRARRRGRARELLEEAARELDRLGAGLWAERAREELSRVSGRAPRGARELTPAETRVVELAADGLANKEIASRLYVTVHTVELHLSHAYAKLGVRSRAQLAARVGRSAAKD